jgi:hypothetical protein
LARDLLTQVRIDPAASIREPLVLVSQHMVWEAARGAFGVARAARP